MACLRNGTELERWTTLIMIDEFQQNRLLDAEYSTPLALLIVQIHVGKSKSTTDTVKYSSFQDPAYEAFGLVDANNVPCLFLRFRAKIYNFNLNDTIIATELADFTSHVVKLHGYCAFHNEVRKRSQLYASWKTNERRRTLKFRFRERFVRRSQHQPDELRWELYETVFAEQFRGANIVSLWKTISHFEGHSISFTSSSNDTASIISAPLNQKFVCKDRLNVTLRSPKYENIVLEFLPEIDVQPMNTGAGFGSNVYICERTRRRTLRESFQSRITVFSGFILGLCSVSALVGHSFRRYLRWDALFLKSNIGGTGSGAPVTAFSTLQNN